MQNTKDAMKGQRNKGDYGEDYACSWLRSRDYIILERNFRHSYYEVDIIAQKGKRIHFIEVKTRWTSSFGHPEESVDRKKFQSMQEGAAGYMDRLGYYMPIQFDIVSVRYSGTRTEVLLVEDVYFFR
jgi:putative endonuclease